MISCNISGRYEQSHRGERPMVSIDQVITEWQHPHIPEYQRCWEHASELWYPKPELLGECLREALGKTNRIRPGTSLGLEPAQSLHRQAAYLTTKVVPLNEFNNKAIVLYDSALIFLGYQDMATSANYNGNLSHLSVTWSQLRPATRLDNCPCQMGHPSWPALGPRLSGQSLYYPHG